MKVWVDAQLPPTLARFLSQRFGLEALHIFELGLLSGHDEAIFQAARAAGAIVITKDSDFVHLLERLGPPPRILWITLGNTGTSNSPRLWRSAGSRCGFTSNRANPWWS